MQISEYFKYRDNLIESIKDDDGVITETSLISIVLPDLVSTKILESEDYESSLYDNKEEKIRINGYSFNESGDRLQIFLVNENSLFPDTDIDDLMVTLKSNYDDLFSYGINFIKKAIKGYINDDIMDSNSIKFLIDKISKSNILLDLDVIEIFLISATASVEARGVTPYPKRFSFDKEELKLNISGKDGILKKSIVIEKKLIDLNFLYDVHVSNGKEYALIVDFERDLECKIEVLRAADEHNFETYLCVIPATAIANLYRNAGGTRILEKNVRSFLGFNKHSVNSGMKTTILKSPEKFIAYNNGLTITATDKILEEVNGKLFLKSLTNFQIVNGGQTTATIYFSKKENLNIDKINLMAKINVAKNLSEDELETLISDIGYYSNRQSKVSGVDNNSIKPQLDKVKSLSNSVITPSGYKWFFARQKGQFETMLRMAGGNKVRLEKEYPKERRFTKEMLGKYYCSWGDRPYIVKFGGEKVFGYFSEELAGDGDKKKPLIIDREFYENLIAKMILVKSLEKIYGQGKGSIGQLRAAVIPYSLAVLFSYTNGLKSGPDFDLGKIWQMEELNSELSIYFKSLMQLINDLLRDKRYNNSDDLSDNTKKKEVWDNIVACKEVKSFINSDASQKIINKYSKSKSVKAKVQKLVNFDIIIETIIIVSKSEGYYREVEKNFNDSFNSSMYRKLQKFLGLIKSQLDIGQDGIDFFKELNLFILQHDPDFFDKFCFEENLRLSNTLNKIISIYNKCIINELNISAEFKLLEQIANKKNIPNASALKSIGDLLADGNAPTLKLIYQTSNFFNNSESNLEKKIDNFPELAPELLIDMLNWNSRNNILNPTIISYITEYAYGLKKINAFEKTKIMNYYKLLVESGYSYNKN
jgi:hypothetical protein